jgi:AGZA family xanthine/uracil permease-like MFS transporter
MAYIIVVNPGILSDAIGKEAFSSILFATVLVSAISSIFMGLFANLPYALAPGMGINAFFTYTLCINAKVPWETALGAVFISGIIFFILSVTPVRRIIVKAIPNALRYAVAAGIGIFLTFIGFRNAGFIVDNPATLVGFGGMSILTVIFVIGIILTAILVIFRVRGHLVISMIAISIVTLLTSIIAVAAGWIDNPLVSMPEKIVALPKFDVFFKLDILGALKWSMIGPIFALIFTDMFDSISTFVGVANTAGLIDEDGEPHNAGRALVVDSVATTLSGLFGTSSATAYIESASGIEEGGRTGLTAVITGLLFLPFMFLAPLLGFVPAVATAPVLVVVGVFMMKPLSKLDWQNYEESIPAFIAMILIPLTFSITQGILWGFILYTAVKLLTGKWKDVHWMLYIITGLSILGLALGYIG